MISSFQFCQFDIQSITTTSYIAAIYLYPKSVVLYDIAEEKYLHIRIVASPVGLQDLMRHNNQQWQK